MTNLFKVDGQTLTPVEIYPAVSNTINYLTFAFMFSYDWDVLVKSAIFTKGSSEYEVVLVNDAIAEDKRVNLSAGEWTLSVVGSTVVGAVVTKQITTTSYAFTVLQSDAVEGEEFPPSVASQVYVNVNQATPQTFVGGIPKLAADRVIDHDNELADKKYVDDKVDTVTADDFNHNDLSNKQGGTAGEYYHTTQAQNAALHAHSNKTALDAVSGTNTGDQTLPTRDSLGLDTDDTVTFANLSGMNTGDQDLSSYAKASDLHEHANKSVLDLVSGTNTGDQDLSSYAKTIDLHSHANKTALDNVSGINTGDQVLPTRDSLGLDTNDVVTFANLSGTNTGDQDAAGVANTPAGNISATTVQAAINELDAEKEAVANKVTSITSASTDTQYPSAKCVYAALNEKHYTFRWDKVNALGVRLNNAQGISTTITNFCHRGTVNTAMDNPFDSIYPWSGINLCNISIDAYRALSTGASLRDCVVSWLGDVDFSYTHENGVWRYTPEFWYKVWDEGGYRYFDVSPTSIQGYVYAQEAVEGRWFGGVYTLTVGGTSQTCLIPRPGMPGKNVAVSTLHTYAKNWGASIENIYGYSATDVLMIVEFATMNTQTAIGNGVSDLYRQSSDTIQAEATASAAVKVLTAAAANCIAGSIFDIGTVNGATNIGSFIIASTALDTDPTYTIVTLTTDGATPASVTVTTDHMWSVHGLSNTVDASIGAASGYIGTNGKSHAYYRGQVAHANLWRYVLGAYRQTGTGKIWVANSSAEADGYDALNAGVHKDTGLTLPQGAGGAAISDYIGSLHLCPDVPAAPFCESIGGSNANPVGDYCYVPTLATANTILFAGGNALSGALCGRFYGYWYYSAATSGWYYGAVPVLKTPI